MVRDYRRFDSNRNLVSQVTGPHTQRAKGNAPAYKYFKIRSSVFDKDGKEIPDSVEHQKLQAENEADALGAGFTTAEQWAKFH